MSFRSLERGSGVLEETKRVARLLDMVARISARPKMWTRRSLAQAFEISERRIQQDLDILVRRLGLPIRHSRSGYYLAEQRALPAVTFAFGEAVALLLSASVGRATAGVGTAELAAALARLKDVFPPEFRRLLDTLELGAGDPGPGDQRRRALELLQEAVATRATVRLRYATASRADAESERLVDPYALVPYVRSFHLVGYCHSRQEVRIFKVDRIRDLRLTAQRFVVPEDFDLGAYLSEGWGLMRGVARAPETVRVRFSARAGRWVSEERWHRGQKAEWQPDGSLLFTLRVGITPPLVRWILYYGAEAQVLEPAWLAEEVKREARALLESYEEAR